MKGVVQIVHAMIITLSFFSPGAKEKRALKLTDHAIWACILLL
jgi:hypothetical protein